MFWQPLVKQSQVHGDTCVFCGPHAGAANLLHQWPLDMQPALLL